MTREDLAAAALDIATHVEARVGVVLLSYTTDPAEQANLYAAVIALLLRRYLRDGIVAEPERWLAEIVRSVLA